jgi:hypothetical protein
LADEIAELAIYDVMDPSYVEAETATKSP